MDVDMGVTMGDVAVVGAGGGGGSADDVKSADGRDGRLGDNSNTERRFQDKGPTRHVMSGCCWSLPAAWDVIEGSRAVSEEF